MKRAIVVVGAESGMTVPTLREYRLILLPRLPRGAVTSAWDVVARTHGFELLASWLVVVGAAEQTDPAIRGVFEGCRDGVRPAALARAVAAIDARACRSRLITNRVVVAERCAAFRRAGKRIVFTNGVFDLFHVGHARLLQAARALGDTLVVGINSDESARRLKGRARPVVPQFARAEMVAAVRGVDLCVIFDQDDPRDLLRLVHPITLVKGSEYARADVVGGSMVEGWGGTVALVPHVAGWSSTRLAGAARGKRK